MIARAIRLNPYHPGWYLFRLGQAYCFMGDYEKSIEVLEEALDRDPNLLPIHIFLALAHSKMGQMEKARADVTKFLKFNPDYSQEIIREILPLKDKRKLESIVESLGEAGLK